MDGPRGLLGWSNCLTWCPGSQDEISRSSEDRLARTQNGRIIFDEKTLAEDRQR